jgi:rhodanese-related sulfurtransferase
VPGAVNISLADLRRDFSALPKDRPVVAYCKVGQRGYYAVRFLRQHGIDARNVTGGILTWNALQETRRA